MSDPTRLESIAIISDEYWSPLLFNRSRAEVKAACRVVLLGAASTPDERELASAVLDKLEG